jgi:hypothetical protein
MTELPSDERAVQLAAEKKKVPEDYLLKILRLARTPASSGKIVEQVEQILRTEADGRAKHEAPPG